MAAFSTRQNANSVRAEKLRPFTSVVFAFSDHLLLGDTLVVKRTAWSARRHSDKKKWFSMSPFRSPRWNEQPVKSTKALADIFGRTLTAYIQVDLTVATGVANSEPIKPRHGRQRCSLIRAQHSRTSLDHVPRDGPAYKSQTDGSGRHGGDRLLTKNVRGL
jgi:hypothetical protein